MKGDYILHMDIAETLFHADKAREYVAKGQTEDAIAYTLAMGFKMGWEAHKKKVENINSK